MTNQERFLQIFNENIKREGADKLLEFLSSGSDFFTAPASTRYHGAHEGGLLEHSLNVYDCLCDILARPRMKEVYGLEYSAESIAVVALLHDICKVNFYKVSTRNVKDENGKWTTVPYYTIEDTLPYGHGEKSVYIVNGFMRLTREEAMAINWHMGGFDPRVRGGDYSISKAYEKYPLAVLTHIADIMASYLDEKIGIN